MKKNEGNKIADPEEVKEIYKNFCDELFEQPKWSGEEQVSRKKVEDETVPHV